MSDIDVLFAKRPDLVPMFLAVISDKNNKHRPLRRWRYTITCNDLLPDILKKLQKHYDNATKACFNLWGDSFYIAGGSVREAFDNSECSDIDVFSVTENPDWQSVHPDADVKKTDNGLYIQQKTWKHPINCVTCQGGDPSDVISNFDLNCSQAAFDGKYLYCTRAFIEAIITKDLYITRWPNDQVSLLKTWERCLKHVHYGYNLPQDLIKALASGYKPRHIASSF